MSGWFTRCQNSNCMTELFPSLVHPMFLKLPGFPVQLSHRQHAIPILSKIWFYMSRFVV